MNAVVSEAVAPLSPDTRLIEMAREAQQIWLQRQLPTAKWWALVRRKDDVISEETNAVAAELEPFTDRLYEFWEAAPHLKATTLQGAAAKAGLAVMRILHERDSVSGPGLECMEMGEHLAFEVCRELVAIGRAA